MDIDIQVGSESFSFEVDNPFNFDVDKAVKDVINASNEAGHDISTLGIEKLVARMIRGVAGCEGGCPADAKTLVHTGFGNFNIEYVDGGILSASDTLKDNTPLEVKVFPGF